MLARFDFTCATVVHLHLKRVRLNIMACLHYSPVPEISRTEQEVLLKSSELKRVLPLYKQGTFSPRTAVEKEPEGK